MNQSEYNVMKEAHEQLKVVVPAARSALSALRFVEKELSDLRDVLPELQPVNRCLYALAGEVEKLSAALPRIEQSVNGAQRAFIGAIDKAIAFHSENQNDPHGVGNAVIAALNEVKTASMEAYKTEQNEAYRHNHDRDGRRRSPRNACRIRKPR